MALLNEPVGFDERPPDDWTPEKGLRRGLARGGAVALALAALTGLAAVFLPFLLIAWLPRCALALGVTWLLGEVMQRAAGMMSRRLGWAALLLTALLLVSHHALFALFGVGDTDGEWWVFPAPLVERVIPATEGVLRGWRWFHPYVLLVVNAGPLVLSAILCAWIYRADFGGAED